MSLHAGTVAKHSHVHRAAPNTIANESKTLKVVVLTLLTMIVEVVAGYLTNSMALLADGWHMGTHAFALGISYSAYRLARHFAHSNRFSFGTGKFGVLGGYTSSLFLGAAAIWMMYESVRRFFNPINIAFDEAIIVAMVGLSVNLLSVWILRDGSGLAHSHHDAHLHDHTTDTAPAGNSHHDHNFRAAYLHVLADALTSILAIVALITGRYLGWVFLDPAMGIVGGVLISRWAYGLLVSSGRVLLDRDAGDRMTTRVRDLVEADGDSKVIDLHIWSLGSQDMAAIISVVSGNNHKPAYYRTLLDTIPHLTHVSVEVHPCEDPCCSD